MTVTTDDFIYEQTERSQRHQSHRRREDRSRRRQLYLLSGIGLIFLLALGAPSLVSHSSIGRSLLVKQLTESGLQADVDGVSVGWITPLRVTGLKINGASGSQLAISEIDLDLTVADLLSPQTDLGQITLRGLAIACSVGDGHCNLEQDFESFLVPSTRESSTSATVKLQDISVAVEDSTTGDVWHLKQSNAEVAITPTQTRAVFAGVLSEPSGDGGSMQGSVDITDASNSTILGTSPQWDLDITCESLPLSAISLLRRRFPEVTTSIPRKIHGDATGKIHLASGSEGTVEAVVQRLEVRDLSASDPGSRVWRNGLATLDGTLVLQGDRVIGQKLHAATDFASATIDGAFSRSFSLIGARDNPLRWLEAIEGTATAEIDLAAFERSLPGVLPLRDEAQLVSGKAIARVDSTPNGTTQQSELVISSQVLRARSRGREIIIDPVELTATVSNAQGHLRAEQFKWKSQFGSAVGQGDLRSGSADFEIDFGRLTSMLGPIFDLSKTGLSGAAQGNVAWNAADDNLWRLNGTAQASDLTMALANGQNLSRSSMHGSIVAEGRWENQTLNELTKIAVQVSSRGMDFNAELVEPMSDPSTKQSLPIHIHAEGRIETLTEIMASWLPVEIHDLSGGFIANASAQVGFEETRITTAAIELSQPKVAYRDRYFQQPNVKIHFDGQYVWPGNELQARSITVAGDAFSVAAKGNAAPSDTAFDLKWRAKLERLQGSVREQMAALPQIRQVGFRPNVALANQQSQTESWLVMGDCEGDISLRTRENVLEIDLDTTGSNLALIQPAHASEASQTMGPMPNRSSDKNLPNPNTTAMPVWTEPNLKINGKLDYDHLSGELTASQVQVASDWFATTLSGSAAWNERSRDVHLNGPSRIKMDEVAKRLQAVTGMEIQATGIHTTPISFRAFAAPREQVKLDIVTNLGWETVDVAGLQFGPASIPVRLTETSVEIAHSKVPVSEGNLSFSGQIHYLPGPLWMRLDAGTTADSIRLTPEMTNRWLKYVAPLAADTTRTEGILGAQLDEAIIVLDQPHHCQLSGRLNIGGIQMNAGPLASQVIQGVDQLKSLSRGMSGQTPTSHQHANLISMPVQQVDFSVAQGVVSHDRLYIEIDRAQIVTSGRVGLDGRLNMIAQIPLDARWLGSDLQGLAGQVVTLPIDGTISRPSLDSQGVQAVAAQLGLQAVQSTAESYIQQQLNKSIDKLFGR